MRPLVAFLERYDALITPALAQRPLGLPEAIDREAIARIAVGIGVVLRRVGPHRIDRTRAPAALAAAMGPGRVKTRIVSGRLACAKMRARFGGSARRNFWNRAQRALVGPEVICKG